MGMVTMPSGSFSFAIINCTARLCQCLPPSSIQSSFCHSMYPKSE